MRLVERLADLLSRPDVTRRLGLIALGLAAVWGTRVHALYAGCLVLCLILAGASTSIVFPEIGVTADEAVNPIVRLTVATVLAISCLTPLLLAGTWAGRPQVAEASADEPAVP